MDNTTFGGNTPTIPQWPGPPRTTVQVQAILFASLTASLFSAFLAMLGKQWLGRYASIEMRGSTIERSQNRQRKLDGIVTWYFDHVMESSPLMLQLALLLLGCALSRYLWDIDKTVASVVLGVTSFGVLFYLFIVVAGAASVSCPYQTPGAHILRHTLPLIPRALRSVSSSVIKGSVCVELLAEWRNNFMRPARSLRHIPESLLATFLLPIWLACDAYLIVRAAITGSITFARRVRSWFRRLRSARIGGLEQQMVALDLQCITWMLQTSFDKAIHLLALRLLATMTTLVEFNPSLVPACFGILAGCVAVVGSKAVITQGSEELAAVSSLHCLRILSHLTTLDPTSSILRDMRQWYTMTFPPGIDFKGLLSYHTFCAIHNVFYPLRPHWIRVQHKNQWEDYKPSSEEHIIAANSIAKLARFEYNRRQPEKVPRWILRFALHSLSQDPLPPTSVVVNCLSIIAIDLGCVVVSTTTPDERCVCLCLTGNSPF